MISLPNRRKIEGGREGDVRALTRQRLDASIRVNTISGPLALALVVIFILSALVAVSSVGGLGGFGPGDIAAIRFTLVQSVLSAAVSVGLAIPVARALARRQFRGRALLVTLLGAPFILPVIVAAFGLLAVLGRAGLVSQVLGFFGLQPLSIYGLQGVVIAHVFFNLPLATRLLLQGWQDIPAEQFRLAAQLGLRRREMFRILEWPMLRRLAPGAFALIFSICLTSFAVALTLGGGPKATTIELAIYQAFRFDFDLGRAAFLSLIQLSLAGAAALLALWLIPFGRNEGGLGRPVQRWDRSIFDPFWIFMAAGFLLIPLGAVVLGGINGLQDVPAQVWTAAWTSLWLALLSTAMMLALTIPIAGWLAGQPSGRLEALGLLGLAASPLMIGTGWFILINPIADPRSFALPVTALVNALTTLPFALRILVPGLRAALQAHGRLGTSLGLGPWQFWRICLLPGLAAPLGFAAGLGAALSVGDLGVIALFADPDRATLPLQMYRLLGAYRTDAAAGAALILLVMALGLFWSFDRLGRMYARA